MEGHPGSRTPVPLGATGRLVALPMSNAVGDHALLVRQGDASRALLTGESYAERSRVVLVPLDDDVELRVDGDALAVWLATGSVGRPQAAVPAWASLIGFGLLLLVMAFTVIGGATVFSWLLSLAP